MSDQDSVARMERCSILAAAFMKEHYKRIPSMGEITPMAIAFFNDGCGKE